GRAGGSFRCVAGIVPRVAVVYATPGLERATVAAMLDGATAPRGLVLAAFGVGTVPVRGRALAPVVKRAVDGGVEVLVVTQRGGIVDLSLYKNSMVLAEAGAVPGGELRVGAAVGQVMHALA